MRYLIPLKAALARAAAGLVFLLLLLSFQACSLADVRPKEMRKLSLEETDQRKGRQLLAEARLAQGADRLAEHETYTLEVVDNWRGLLGGIANPWPVNGDELHLHYEVGTFDVRAEIQEGKKEGDAFGMQSWNTYRQEEGETIAWKRNRKHAFVLAAVQYFFEITDRLSRAPIITYAGQHELYGSTYEGVYVTWEDYEPHRANDQYLLYIHPETKLVHGILFTTREVPNPAPPGWYGNIFFTNWQEVEGYRYPATMTVQLNKFKAQKRWIHQINIESVEFDRVSNDYIDANPALTAMGDEKPSR